MQPNYFRVIHIRHLKGSKGSLAWDEVGHF